MIPKIPEALIDAGSAVLVLLLVVALVYQIVKLVGMLRGKPANGDSKRERCVQTGVVQQLVSNQQLVLETSKDLKQAVVALKENSLRQTIILEQLAKNNEKVQQLQGTQTRLLARICAKLRLDSEEGIAEMGG